MKTKVFAIFLSGLIIAPTFLMSIPKGRANFQPYKKTFIVTAYYSPVAGQDFYVTGSLASDKRLNGNGTHGADGTPVYPGMIAAPSTYSFGSRVSCPGYIDGEIHDRGGAIVKAGKRNNSYDRLDFWAGYGDKALKTALYWGKRTLTCTVYPPGYSKSFKQYVQLPRVSLQQKYYKKTNKKPTNTKSNYDFIAKKYKKMLSTLGYDPEDKSARTAFQMRHNIIKSTSDKDAGLIGPNTKNKLENIFQEIEKNTPIENLSFGDINTNVRKLQKILNKQGYLQSKSTAIFGKQTEEALKKFQLDKKLIKDEKHPAAGYLGPATQKALKETVQAPYNISDNDQALITELNKDKIAAEALAKANTLGKNIPATASKTKEPDKVYDMLESLSKEWIKEHSPTQESKTQASLNIQLASSSEKESPELKSVKEKLAPVMNPFRKKLREGSKGQEVRKIQTLLKKLGFFEGEKITDYFGSKTKQAIIDFQVYYNIIPSKRSPGAGTIGPKTLQALNAGYYQQEFSLPYEVGQVFRAPAINPKDLKPALQQASLDLPKKS